MRRLVVCVAMVLGAASAARALTVEKLLGGGRLVVYAGRDAERASARALALDAERLAAVGFRAVVTDGASPALAPACRFFKRHGFRTAIVGIHDPRDAAEIARAIRLRRCADGYAVGDGGLGTRYGRGELDAAIRRVRARSGRPVAVRETAEALRGDASLLAAGDWLFPVIQPWPAGHRDPQDACGFTIYAYRDVAEEAPAGVATVVAATGLPTEGDPTASEHYQRAYFLCLESRQVPFGYFAARDREAPASDPLARHAGVFRADGSPKLWAAQQLQPAIAAERSGGEIRGRVTRAPRGLVRVVAYVARAPWTVAAAAVPDRTGRWRMIVPPDVPVRLYLASEAWAPPAGGDRAPRTDRTQVFAERDLPPG